MSIRNTITEKMILPLSDIVVGHSIARQLAFLNKSQWWSSEELLCYQNKKLSNLINFSYENIPYYRDVMDSSELKPTDIQNISELKNLPILTKTIFKENYPHNLLLEDLNKGKILNRSSSGSTGTPIQYSMTREGYSFNKACNLRGWYWMGFRLGDKLIKISQNKRSNLEKKFQDFLDNTLLFASGYTRESFHIFIKSYNLFKPKFLRSYPDPLQFLSMLLKEQNKSLSGLKAINTTGNILFPEIRELIEERFNVRVFDSYSCEGGPNFFECHTHECYHASMEYGICEILDDNQNEVPSGGLGKLYTTDLWNYASPFIRYDSGDLVRKSKEQCSCGRNLLSISEIIGRDNDVIITPNGQFLIAQTFTTYFKYIPSIKQFQIIQEKVDMMEIKLVIDDNTFSKKIEEEIIRYWKKYVKNSMEIRVSLLDSIPLLPSGKRRFLIRSKDITFKI